MTERAKCEHLVTPPYPNGFPRPRQCQRLAVAGSDKCAQHQPEAIEARKKRAAEGAVEKHKLRVRRTIALNALRARSYLGG